MYYSITVTDKVRGEDLFSTHPDSIPSAKALKAVYALLIVKFPKNKGYTLTVTRNSMTSFLLQGDQLDLILGNSQPLDN